MRKETRFFMISGALGCMLGGLLSELWHAPTSPKPEPAAAVSRDIALVLDVSGSMNDDGKLQEVKDAAQAFTGRQNLEKTQISVVGFGSDTHLALPLSKTVIDIRQAIGNLSDGGGTNMAGGLETGLETLKSSPKAKSILLFTDGVPEYDNVSPAEARRQTLNAAQRVRSQGIQIVAVATQSADIDFLEEVTGDPKLVFLAQSGNFGQAFQEAQAAIEGLFGNSQTLGGALWESALRGGLAALFLGAFLLVSQNRFSLRGRLTKDLTWVPWASGGLGALGGVAGQLVISSDGSRSLGWAVLGAGTGLLLGLADRSRTLALRGAFGGFVGGLVGGAFFQTITSLVGAGVGARLLGFGILGAAIGFMVQWIQQTFKGAWLYGLTTGPFEGKQYILAKSTVSLGRSDANDIGLYREMDLPLHAGTFEQKQGQWHWQGEALLVNGTLTKDTPLHSGDRIKVGGTEFVFQTRQETGHSTLDGWTLHDNQHDHELTGKRMEFYFDGPGIRSTPKGGDFRVDSKETQLVFELLTQRNATLNGVSIQPHVPQTLKAGDFIESETVGLAVLRKQF